MQTRESVVKIIILISLLILTGCAKYEVSTIDESKSPYSYSTQDFSNSQIDSIINEILISKQYIKLSETMKPGFVTEEEDRYCGSEYKGARAYNFVDLNKDKKDDVLVFFTLESMGCGMSYNFYLASILNKNNQYELANYIHIGGKMSQTPVYDTLRVQGDVITIPMMMCDGNPFPVRRDSIEVQFNNGVLEDYLEPNNE